MTLAELKEETEKLLLNINMYQTTGTKASSKRIRTSLGAIKNATSAIRRSLVEADKAGKTFL